MHISSAAVQLLTALLCSWSARAKGYPVQQGQTQAPLVHSEGLPSPAITHWYSARGNMASKTGSSGCCSRPSATSPSGSPAHPSHATARPSASSSPWRIPPYNPRPYPGFRSSPQGRVFGWSSASGTDPDSKSSGKGSPASSTSSDFSHGPVRSHTPSPPPPARPRFRIFMTLDGGPSSGPRTQFSHCGIVYISRRSKEKCRGGKGKAAISSSSSSSSSSSLAWRPASGGEASGTQHSSRGLVQSAWKSVKNASTCCSSGSNGSSAPSRSQHAASTPGHHDGSVANASPAQHQAAGPSPPRGGPMRAPSPPSSMTSSGLGTSMGGSSRKEGALHSLLQAHTSTLPARNLQDLACRILPAWHPWHRATLKGLSDTLHQELLLGRPAMARQVFLLPLHTGIALLKDYFGSAIQAAHHRRSRAHQTRCEETSGPRAKLLSLRRLLGADLLARNQHQELDPVVPPIHHAGPCQYEVCDLSSFSSCGICRRENKDTRF
ncbi:unnamed protein product [Sympodiomycopsis kandeliae]